MLHLGSKINNTFIDNAKGLDIAMPIYNMLENSDSYSMTSVSLWNYYKDEISNEVVPLKYLSNFWKSLDLPLINCKIEIDLS